MPYLAFSALIGPKNNAVVLLSNELRVELSKPCALPGLPNINRQQGEFQIELLTIRLELSSTFISLKVLAFHAKLSNQKVKDDKLKIQIGIRR